MTVEISGRRFPPSASNASIGSDLAAVGSVARAIEVMQNLKERHVASAGWVTTCAMHPPIGNLHHCPECATRLAQGKAI
jgi:hypothetical protein